MSTEEDSSVCGEEGSKAYKEAFLTVQDVDDT